MVSKKDGSPEIQVRDHVLNAFEASLDEFDGLYKKLANSNLNKS